MKLLNKSILFFCRKNCNYSDKCIKILNEVFTKVEVIGFTDVTRTIPKTIERTLGIIIIEKFDIPEIFIAIISSVFLIFRKNHIPDKNIINGNILNIKFGTTNTDYMIGIL